jgi:hypothetical protein
MRTADTIAQQGERQDSERKPSEKPKYKVHPNSLKNLRPPWKPGEVPNPEGGRAHRKYDVAAIFARAVIEGTLDQAFQGFARQLAKGNAYTFKELADRGYGKVKEKLEVGGMDALAAALVEGRKRVASRRNASK